MDITFLGTGGAWGVPEMNCNCAICREMRAHGERRDRTSILLTENDATLLIDCGPDAREQLSRNNVTRIDGVLISHEHNDHYIGLDELFVYKRVLPKEGFSPIPVYSTPKTREVIEARFAYLEKLGVIRFVEIEPEQWFEQGSFRVFPFKTDHGVFAKGSVGFMVQGRNRSGHEGRVLYTSDFADIPNMPSALVGCDYVIMQSFWLNEPVENRPSHMSFQNAIDYIKRLKPSKETFLVHMGDADRVPGDPANHMAKKYEPKDPLKPLNEKDPYPIPGNQLQWQKTVDRILSDYDVPHKVTVAHDNLTVQI
ncbi:MAG: MBL fold metallo-hydrolase [Deltaproteobacteria bacterium]|nr:MBL fold metallo-hydrolase [Deltaproteobacteria bacterium]